MKTLFNSGWQFAEALIDNSLMTKDGKPNLLNPTDFFSQSQKQDFKPVHVPHDWMITNTNALYRSSIGYYKKTFDIEETAEKHFALLFEGVYMNSAVYVNGKLAGIWKYGYAQFEYDISSLVKKGSNEVLVICVYQSPNTRWYSGAGIFRDVHLIESSEDFLVTSGTYIRTRKNEDGSWTVKVSAEAAFKNSLDDIKIRHTLMQEASEEDNEKIRAMLCTTSHPAGKDDAFSLIVHDEKNIPLKALSESENKKLGEVVSGIVGRKIARSEAEFKVENPKLWSCKNPNLYKLRTELCDKNGNVIDRTMENIGFRTVEFDSEKGMFLNGEHTKIYGVCQHHDLGGLGAAFDLNALRRQFIRLHEMGVNAIRTSHNPVTNSFMSLADEMGFLIDNDGFDMWEMPKTTYDYGNYFNEWSERDTASWVRKDRNHPCLIMWSFGNEIYDTHAGNGLKITENLIKYIREHDPECNAAATIASNYMMTEGAQKCAEQTDVVGYNYLERLYSEHHQKYPHWKIYGSETASTIQSRGIYHFPLTMNLVTHDDRQCSTLGNCTTTWGCESTQKVITNDRDASFSAGQFIWTGWDYIGEPTPYNNTSKSSYFGQIDTAGFPKDTFYLYKAEWGAKNTAPFVHILPYWDWNEGQMIDVKAYTNMTEVELFLNGESLGRQKIDHEKGMDLFGLWRVAYKKGELKAVAYNEKGEPVCEEIKCSFGDPVKIVMKPELFQKDGKSPACEKCVANGSGTCHIGDLYFFDIMTADENGYDVSNARNIVSVGVQGEADFVCMDNGDSTDYDQYTSSTRRLFGNRLVAIIRAKSKAANFTVKAASKDLEGVEIVIKNGEVEKSNPLPASNSPAPFGSGSDEYKNFVPVRKIEILPQGELKLTAQNKNLPVKAVIRPQNATCDKVTFSPMLPESVLSDAVQVQADGCEATLKAVCDGKFILRVTANNGRDYPEIISELDMCVEGVGNPKFNPYKLVEACRFTNYDKTKPRPKNGFTGGISTRGAGGGWVSFDKVDFGIEGADEINIPAFCWDASWPLKVYDGEPDTGECVFDGNFCAEYQYNTYTEKSFTLTRRLFGVHTISIWVGIELVWHGFRFTQSPKAFAKLRALDADTVVGDSFTKTSDAIEKIGNNVNLDFANMDFGSGGATKVTICGKSNIPNNTINLKFFGENACTQVIEFAHTDDYEEKTFALEKIAGKNKVSFVFLPGCNFDFKWFRFE